jgi:hypothetical protein
MAQERIRAAPGIAIAGNLLRRIRLVQLDDVGLVSEFEHYRDCAKLRDLVKANSSDEHVVAELYVSRKRVSRNSIARGCVP